MDVLSCPTKGAGDIEPWQFLQVCRMSVSSVGLISARFKYLFRAQAPECNQNGQFQIVVLSRCEPVVWNLILLWCPFH